MSASLQPRSLERPADVGGSLVGVLDSPAPFVVDGGGLVQPPSAGWSLDWWIGADDRWYLPAREASVRQHRRGFGPIIETSMRVPSGDVVHTAYASLIGGHEVCVVEITNQSPVPVALALAVRPYGIGGTRAPLAAARVNDHQLQIDQWRLTLPRRPNELGFSLVEDLVDVVEGGGRLSWPDDDALSSPTPAGRFPNAVVMFPLPHSTTIRICISPSDTPVTVSDLPDVVSVAKGWDVIVDRGGRFEFPDPGLTALAGAARARLLLGTSQVVGDITARLQPSSPSWRRRLRPGSRRSKGRPAGDGSTEPSPLDADPSAVLAALAESGHLDKLAAWLSELSRAPLGRSTDDQAAAFVDGAAIAAVMLGDQTLLDELVELLAVLTSRLDNRQPTERSNLERHWTRAALGLLAVADRSGQVETAATLRARLRESAAPSIVGHQELSAWSQAAHPSGRWNTSDPVPHDSLDLAARFWRAARARLLSERVAEPIPTIELLPDFPSGWRGGSVEVHQAMTLYGPVSFALRWHGARPALLWDQGEGSIRLICPSLDPSWSTMEAKGETLLAGSSDGLVEVPKPGDSFI